MSFTRRTGNFGKHNSFNSIGQRRTGANNFGNGGQNAQQPTQQLNTPQQQQLPPQVQQQEKARVVQQQPAQNQQAKQIVQKPPQQQQIQKPPQLQQAQKPPQPQQIQKPPQPQQIQKPPQLQQIQKPPQPQQIQKPLQQQQAQKPPQQQQAQKPPQQQQAQKPPQQQQFEKPQVPILPQQKQQQEVVGQKYGLSSVAEEMIIEQSNSQPVLSTNSVDIPGFGNEGTNPAIDTTESAPQQKTRPFWMKRNSRINRVERAKRRNTRLRKLLQPKNALMIINELVGHVPFELSETKSGAFEDLYKATVAVEGTEHVGFGKSKALAKTAAAETAVRSMILNKLKVSSQPSSTPEDENKDDNKMEVTEEGQDDVSWTHIASFAIHKLFAGWDEDGNPSNVMSRATSVGSIDNISSKDGIAGLQTQPEQKPAKKLPENAALMNPIMLLNQMHPTAKYEELGKSGAPPNVMFTIQCVVGTQSFVGSGPNKKAAKKLAAVEACKTLLGIQYPPDILQGTSEKSNKMETS